MRYGSLGAYALYSRYILEALEFDQIRDTEDKIVNRDWLKKTITTYRDYFYDNYGEYELTYRGTELGKQIYHMKSDLKWNDSLTTDEARGLLINANNLMSQINSSIYNDTDSILLSMFSSTVSNLSNKLAFLRVNGINIDMDRIKDIANRSSIIVYNKSMPEDIATARKALIDSMTNIVDNCNIIKTEILNIILNKFITPIETKLEPIPNDERPVAQHYNEFKNKYYNQIKDIAKGAYNIEEAESEANKILNEVNQFLASDQSIPEPTPSIIHSQPDATPEPIVNSQQSEEPIQKPEDKYLLSDQTIKKYTNLIDSKISDITSRTAKFKITNPNSPNIERLKNYQYEFEKLRQDMMSNKITEIELDKQFMMISNNYNSLKQVDDIQYNLLQIHSRIEKLICPDNHIPNSDSNRMILNDSYDKATQILNELFKKLSEMKSDTNLGYLVNDELDRVKVILIKYFIALDNMVKDLVFIPLLNYIKDPNNQSNPDKLNRYIKFYDYIDSKYPNYYTDNINHISLRSLIHDMNTILKIYFDYRIFSTQEPKPKTNPKVTSSKPNYDDYTTTQHSRDQMAKEGLEKEYKEIQSKSGLAKLWAYAKYAVNRGREFVAGLLGKLNTWMKKIQQKILEKGSSGILVSIQKNLAKVVDFLSRNLHNLITKYRDKIDSKVYYKKNGQLMSEEYSDFVSIMGYHSGYINEEVMYYDIDMTIKSMILESE